MLIVSMLVLAGVLRLGSPGAPRPFLDATGEAVAGSVSEKTWIDVNGVRQGRVVRGEDDSHLPAASVTVEQYISAPSP